MTRQLGRLRAILKVDENERHRTAKELFKRAEEKSSLIRRIGQTLKLPNLTEGSNA
jgi:hypothetical protein